MKTIAIVCPVCCIGFFSCKIFVQEKELVLTCTDCFKGFTVSTDELSVKMLKERMAESKTVGGFE